MLKNKTLLIVIISFFFFSCSNFLDSGNLKEEVNEKIEYSNAEEVTVRITSDEGSGITFPNGDTTFKIGYDKDISFEENPNYSFSKWCAYEVTKNGENEIEKITNLLEFDNPYSIKTTAKILKSSNGMIKIKPLCYIKPFIYSVYPQYPKDNIVLNDTSISIAFSTPNNIPIEKSSFYFSDEEIAEYMDKELEISFLYDSNGNAYGYESYSTVYYKSIKVEYDGKSILEYFGAPVINGNIFVLPVNSSKGIPVEDTDYKEISVTIGNNIYCELDDGTKLKLVDSDSNNWSYRIKKNNQETGNTNAIIQFTGNQNIEELNPIQGSYTYSLNQVIDLMAKVNSSSYFIGWKVITPNGTYEYDGQSSEKSMYILNENGNIGLIIEDCTASSTKITIKNGISGVVITPVCEKIPVADIRTVSNYGKVTPEGSYSCMLGNSFNLSFAADDEYSFSHWQVKLNGNILNSQEIFNYIDIDVSKIDNNVKIKKVPENGTIQFSPICNIRPKIVTYSPIFSNGGTYRDSRIKVLFDSKMSEKSFFWTKAELEASGITEDGGYSVFKCSSLKDSENNDLYYAYCLKNNNVNDLSTMQFKNIKIQNLQTKESLLNYYKEPFFETETRDVLIIPSKVGEAEAVPPATDVYVTIEKSVFDENNISLVSSVNWCYFTGTKHDSDAPKITISSILTYHDIDGVTDTTGNNLILLGSEEEQITPTNENTKDYIRTDKRLYIKGAIEDDGSLPSELLVKVKKINTDMYQNTESEKTYVQKLVPVINEATFEISETVLNSLFEDSGFYQISLSAYDNNGNCKTNVYKYVLYDNENPELPKIVNSFAEKDKINLNLQLTNQDLDLDTVIISINGNSYDYYKNKAIINNSFNFDSLTNGTNYTMTITATDYAGNQSTTTWTEYAGSKIGMYYYENQDRNFYSSHYYESMKSNLMGVIALVDETNCKGSIIGLKELNGQKTAEDYVRDFQLNSFTPNRKFNSGVTWLEANNWISANYDSNWHLINSPVSLAVTDINKSIKALNDNINYSEISTGLSSAYIGDNLWGNVIIEPGYWTQTYYEHSSDMGGSNKEYQGHQKTNFCSYNVLHDRSGYKLNLTKYNHSAEKYFTGTFNCTDYGYSRAFREFDMN